MVTADHHRLNHWVRIGICFAVFILPGCRSLFGDSDDPPVPTARMETPKLPGGSGAHRVSQFVFYSDIPLRTNSPLFAELSELRETIHKELQLPSSNNLVQVYLFDDQEKYDRYMRSRYPDLPRRRAFFIAQPRAGGGQEELLVFTYWGEHIRQDLRHELTHAMLHGVLKEVPLWLDEGLAEYYELPPERQGLNWQHVEAIKRTAAYPDLAALEKLDQVGQMGRSQYQQSWAWVHLMLRGNPEARKVLLAYLQEIRQTGSAPVLLPRLKTVWPAPNDALAQHIVRLDAVAASIQSVGHQR